MVASVLEVKLFVGHAGMHACAHIYCKHIHKKNNPLSLRMI